MSVSPAQNFSKPPPVPEMPTVTLMSGLSSLNSSAAASVNGPTVEEPSIVILPFRSPLPDELDELPEPELSPLPQAATANESSAAPASVERNRVCLVIILLQVVVR